MSLEILATLGAIFSIFACIGVLHLHLTIDTKLAEFQLLMQKEIDQKFIPNREANLQFNGIHLAIEELKELMMEYQRRARP